MFSFEIFTTNFGFVLIGLLAALMVVLWDWRAAVPALILTQWGVSSLLVQRFNMPEAWGLAFLFLAILSGALLGLSALQADWNRHVAPSNIMPLRILVVSLAYLLIRSQTLRLPIPQIDDSTVTLFTWLALAALLPLILGDSPLHTGLGLSLWFVPIHAVTATLLPNPALIVLMGSAQLSMVLACSYLMLPVAASRFIKRPTTQDIAGHIPADLASSPDSGQWRADADAPKSARPSWLQRRRTATPGGSQ